MMNRQDVASVLAFKAQNIILGIINSPDFEEVGKELADLLDDFAHRQINKIENEMAPRTNLKILPEAPRTLKAMGWKRFPERFAEGRDEFTRGHPVREGDEITGYHYFAGQREIVVLRKKR